MHQITRIVQGEEARALGAIPSQAERGVVEEIDVTNAEDGYNVQITRVLWTRNKRRRDEREEFISRQVIFTLSAHDAVHFMRALSYALLHSDSRGPKEDS